MRQTILRLTCIGTLAVSLAFVALVASPSSAQAAPADGYQNASQYCMALAAYLGISDTGGFQGACVSEIESDGQSSAAAAYICKYVVPQGYFPNVGQCVSTLNKFTP